ncbi:UDP-glycosyltransferase 90A1 [Linum perenne]
MEDSQHNHHVLIFPFMAKGHTIPILHLVHLLLRRQVAVTVITTPANLPFIAQSLHHTAASIVQLPFPPNLEGIPQGVESTDKLPSMSLFPRFALATKLMQPDFERALQTLVPIHFMISDGFLWWTLESAIKYGFPRLVFNGMCNYSICVFRTVNQSGVLFGKESDDELIPVPSFPWIKVTKNDFESHVWDQDAKTSPDFEFVMKSMMASKSSYGYVVNSFYELEPVFVDSFNNFLTNGPKAWCVGPLCLAKAQVPSEALVIQQKPSWIQWLDEKHENKRSVPFVAFGSQAKVPPEQLREISAGLEKSNVNFLWVTKEQESKLGDGFEERIRGVPVLAWPMMAEQHLNARMVVEELKVGIRVETSNGSVRGFVKWEGLEKTVRELMEGVRGVEVKKKVKDYSRKAMQAMEEDTGSSWRTLDMLINEIRDLS